MRIRARILLILLSVMATTALSLVFGRCYVIDSTRPDAAENTPPVKSAPTQYSVIL